MHTHNFKSRILSLVLSSAVFMSALVISNISVSAAAIGEKIETTMDHSTFDYYQTVAYKRNAGEQTYTATYSITGTGVTDISDSGSSFNNANYGAAPSGCNRTIEYTIYVNFTADNTADTVTMKAKLPVPYNYVASSAQLYKNGDAKLAGISETGENYIIVSDLQETVPSTNIGQNMSYEFKIVVHFHEHYGITRGSDENYHWYVCDDDSTVYFKEAHIFEGDTCTDCYYKKTNTASDGSSEGTPASEGTDLQDASGNDGGFKVTSSDASNPTVIYEGTEADKSKTTITIPDTVTDASGNVYKVTAINSRALKGSKNVKTVTVGNNVEVIGSQAFANCKKLSKVTLGSSVTKIESKAFSGDKKLKKITIKSKKLKTVQKNAFKNVSSTVTVKVPKKSKAKYTKLLKKGGLSVKATIK
ncbi:MAG: leucine-rich repeat domain-containing protein [Butyrivibrio sp.]|nr:leucine-rich repeat domain-containing protein [Butyrivibrio sp.]